MASPSVARTRASIQDGLAISPRMAAALPARGFIRPGPPPPCQRAAPSPEAGHRRCERAASSSPSSSRSPSTYLVRPPPCERAAHPFNGRRRSARDLSSTAAALERAVRTQPTSQLWPSPASRARPILSTFKIIALQRAVLCTPVRNLPSGSSKQAPPPPFFLAIEHHFLAIDSILFSRLHKFGTNMVNKISSSWEGEEREREGDRETGTRVTRSALSNVSDHLWEPVWEPRGPGAMREGQARHWVSRDVHLNF